MNLGRALRGKEKLTGRHISILGAIIAAGLLCIAWSAEYTSRSDFCAGCHEMAPMYQTWTMSSHKNVACVDCHSEPGLKGLIKEKAKGMKEVYLHITGSYAVIQADTSEINCYSCHQDKVKTNAEQALAIKSPHTVKHFANGMNCVTCHSGLVHNEKLNQAVPSREQCTTCHLDQMTKS